MEVSVYTLKKILKKLFARNDAPDAPPNGHVPTVDPANLVRLSDSTGPILFGTPVVLCGCVVKGKPNFNTLGNFGILSLGPPRPVVYISSKAEHYTNIGIREHNEFSIGIPNQSVMTKLDYCGVVSGKNVDKSTVFPVYYGTLPHAPVITECPVSFTCKVTNRTIVGAMEVFFGEIIEKFAQGALMVDGKLDPEKIKPLCFGPGNAFRVVEAKVGTPWSENRKYTKRG